MGWHGILAAVMVALGMSQAHGDPLSTDLSTAERQELEGRLRAFHAGKSMDDAPGKFGVKQGRPVDPNPALKLRRNSGADPLMRQAQAKGTERYRQQRCDGFLRKQFPSLGCDKDRSQAEALDATAGAHDSVETLAHGWLETVSHDLSALPRSGAVRRSYWSGDYWRMQWGLTSYRYSRGGGFGDYRGSVDSYSQPSDWLSLTRLWDPEKVAAEVLKWSPAEKYDLTVGDPDFTLTNQQKHDGEAHLGTDGDVESWFGLCHGWAPAAVFVPPPVSPVDAVGERGAKVTWYPDDVRAMATLAWSSGKFRTNHMGGRCNAKTPKRYENGRLSDESCVDTNPSSFHLALANLIGREGVPFVMDASYDYQVWNQPVLSYEFVYFDPTDPARRSEEWAEVAVDYDERFKRSDRFQKPLTRGRRLGPGSYDDSEIRRVVGVIATVVYLGENTASHGPTPGENHTVRVSYTYDLELHENSGNLSAQGGEWHENAHPDFLWVPRRGSIARTFHDGEPVTVDLGREPNAELKTLARQASRAAYPLCRVLEKLLGVSAGGGYSCDSER